MSVKQGQSPISADIRSLPHVNLDLDLDLDVDVDLRTGKEFPVELAAQRSVARR